ncbi:uncharacterized protein LOC143444989 [Clavelina lepadiformis]|uniref:uncharacterized protein LOC143444989 n=1 Tax=Clavelina lepadiformis TaxID=159417 RepID=UPI0040420046
MFVCLLLTCFFLFTSAAQTNLHPDTQKFLLCQRSHSLGLYTFDDDIHCQTQTPFSIHNCSATVFAPDLHLQKIPATVCTSQITSWSTTYFFFGSYQKSANTFDAHPPYNPECSSWNKTNVSSHGPLILSNPAAYSTRNAVHYKFVWPTSASGTVTNDFLFHTTIYYDYVTDTMTSSLGSLASCSIGRGYCLTGNRMFIWRVPSHINCPPTKPLGTHKMLLHYNSTSLYRVSLPDLGISVHHWRKCSSRAKNCYGKHIHCDNNNFIFRYQQCTELDRLALFRPNRLRRAPFRTPYSQFERLFATFDTQQDDLISEVLTTFNEENKFLHCQLTKLIGTLYKAIGKIFPTEILTTTLGHQTMGSSLGDFMSRAACHSINGTVLPSLAYRNAFSQRPLIKNRDQNGHSQYGQLISDNIVLPGVHLLESYRPARSFVFRVLGHTVLYHNYTLSHEHVQVHQLNLPLSPIHVNYKAPDYEKILNELPDSDSFTDLQSLLSSMSEANLLKEQMRHVMTSLTTTDETMINGSYVADTFAHAAKQTLLLALSQITNPFLSALIFILQLLAMMWALFHTIGFIRSSPHHLQYARSLVSRVRAWRHQQQAPVARPQLPQPLPLPRRSRDEPSPSGSSDDAPPASSSRDNFASTHTL